jgi:hypothetical protein
VGIILICETARTKFFTAEGAKDAEENKKLTTDEHR